MFSTDRKPWMLSLLVAGVVVLSGVSSLSWAAQPASQTDTVEGTEPGAVEFLPAVVVAGAGLAAIGGGLKWAADKLYDLGTAHGRLAARRAQGQKSAPPETVASTDLEPILD